MNDNNLNTRTGCWKKHNKFWRIFWSVVAIIVVCVAGFAWHEYNSVKNVANNAYRSGGITSAENAVIKSKKLIAILLIGTDTGALGRTYKGRADSIMVAVLNPNTNKTPLVSLERDIQVNLPDYPEHSPSKLNAAYAYGNAGEGLEEVLQYPNQCLRSGQRGRLENYR